MSKFWSLFWVPQIFSAELYEGPQKGTMILTTTHVDHGFCWGSSKGSIQGAPSAFYRVWGGLRALQRLQLCCKAEPRPPSLGSSGFPYGLYLISLWWYMRTLLVSNFGFEG